MYGVAACCVAGLLLWCCFIVSECWFCCFFFFSSRRRHTRFDCDWSSDVCSSDLGVGMCTPVLTKPCPSLPRTHRFYCLSKTPERVDQSVRYWWTTLTVPWRKVACQLF